MNARESIWKNPFFLFFTCKNLYLFSDYQVFSVFHLLSLSFPVFTRYCSHFEPVLLTVSDLKKWNFYGSHFFHQNSPFSVIFLWNSCEHNIHVMFTISRRAFWTELSQPERNEPAASNAAGPLIIVSEGIISYCGGRCNSQQNRQ